MARTEIDLDALQEQIVEKARVIIDDAIRLATEDSHARVAVLEALAAEILGTFSKGSDGYRARAGQIAVARWEHTLAGDDDG